MRPLPVILIYPRAFDAVVIESHKRTAKVDSAVAFDVPCRPPIAIVPNYHIGRAYRMKRHPCL